MSELEGLFQLRPYTPEDIPFIHNSWGTSYYRCSGANKVVDSRTFHERHRPLREAFFHRPTAAVIVACDKSDPWLIVGWIALEQIPEAVVVHYVSVKSAFKGQGIAKWMFSQVNKVSPVTAYTHKTKDAKAILNKGSSVLAQLTFVPHLI